MMKQSYVKEEEFLNEFYDVGSVAAKLIDGEWEPNPDCTDSVRKNQKYFLSTGELNSLVFDSAWVYHDAKGFSCAQIVLKSSKRVVNIRVKKVDGKLVGEKLVDKPQD